MTPEAIEQLTWILQRAQARAAEAWAKIDLAQEEALRLGHEAHAIADILKLHELEIKENE